MKFKQLGLVGCGLMGASFALALQDKGLVERVVGFSPSESTRDEIAPHLQKNSLLMDVGSTKCDVVAAARAALGDRLHCFLPAHPIAGKAQAGVDHAEATLYQDRTLILTPLAHNTPAQIQQATAIWQAIGSRVHQMTPDAHDQTFAAVSHVPHLLAFAQVNGLLQQAEGEAFLKLAGPGFRDFSRIAAGDPKIWRDIFLANADQVLAQLAHFQTALKELEKSIENNDLQTLHRLIDNASQARSNWRLSSGDDSEED